MKLEVFAIHDKATNTFERPFYFLTTAEAIRAFTTECNKRDSMCSIHPYDYSLYRLGSFNQDTGEFEADIVKIGTAASFKNPENVTEIKAGGTE